MGRGGTTAKSWASYRGLSAESVFFGMWGGGGLGCPDISKDSVDLRQQLKGSYLRSGGEERVYVKTIQSERLLGVSGF